MTSEKLLNVLMTKMMFRSFDDYDEDWAIEQIRQAILEEREACAVIAENMLGCEADQIAEVIRNNRETP